MVAQDTSSIDFHRLFCLAGLWDMSENMDFTAVWPGDDKWTLSAPRISLQLLKNIKITPLVGIWHRFTRGVIWGQISISVAVLFSRYAENDGIELPREFEGHTLFLLLLRYALVNFQLVDEDLLLA